ncbi:hypothetical protein [Richelia sinica]|uniref:hypothetical protein n=1 Tax=Richelia sinica TaxID=1357545 RepID=UPI001689824F|nr:hypothetical protein [Richelia sinica]MBD2664054.1 hypothetical protein [Richelia sinica FACHB-800]
MRTTRKITPSASSSCVQLELPLYRKPILHIKKKVRGKNRKGFDLLEEAVNCFQIALDRNEIKSPEARDAIRQFLSFVK